MLHPLLHRAVPIQIQSHNDSVFCALTTVARGTERAKVVLGV